ncbi:hypothetical protein FACS189413_00030 [Bacteroidia bacterium]|nr:hypothetical protein FACS189413_00030 [Bacteroidia bacterium]
MKKLNHSFLKGFNFLLAALMGLLGFTNCEGAGSREEYGAPYSDYVIKGKVVDHKTGSPIKGIKVGELSSFAPMYGTIYTEYYKQQFLPDTTGTNGNYEIRYVPYLDNNRVELFAEDIDSTENGVYINKTVGVDFDNAQKTKPENGWYRGEYTVTQDIELDSANE